MTPRRGHATHHTAKWTLWALILSAVGVLILCEACPCLAHHNHWAIPNSMRKELKIELTVGPLPGSSALLPMHLNILHPGMGLESGFGVKVFVDTVKVYTDLSATETVHDYYLDLAQIGAGYHYIIANVCDHHDHIGVDSVWIKVLPELTGVVQYQQTPTELIERWRQGQRGWPGRYTVAPMPMDPTLEAPQLQCCGRFTDWPGQAQDRDMVRVEGW